MPFQLSPGVQVVEKDFTSIVPAVASSTGAFAGAFQWGPVLDPVRISSENELVSRFGKPTDANADSFFTAANFLAYTSNLIVIRGDGTNAVNAVATPTAAKGTITEATMVSGGGGYTSAPTVTLSAPAVGGTQATATAILSGGGVYGVAVTSGGADYDAVTTSIVVTNPVGFTGVSAELTAVIVAGEITDIAITTPGTGYATAPTVSVVDTGIGSGAVIGAVTLSGSSITGITITNPGIGYASAPTVTFTGGGGLGAVAKAFVSTGGVKVNNINDYNATYANGAGAVGEFAAKFPGSLGNSILVSMADAATFSTWAYKNEFDSAPGTSEFAAAADGKFDELHIIVLDADGAWTGTKNAILEKYAFVSKASDAKKSDGANNYYKAVINSQSRYLWWMDHTTQVGAGKAWGTPAVDSEYATLTAGVSVTRKLSGGFDDMKLNDAALQNAWSIFRDDGQYDISLLPLGNVSASTASFVINNVAEYRRDCVAFVSPRNVTSGDIIDGSGSQATDQIIAYRNALPSSSYAVMDTGSKYQYDRYNDKYRFVSLSGDIAGLCARTDYTNDPWFSPGGLNRGQIKNVIRLAVNPNRTDRDELYKLGINPVVTFPGQGTVLYGDKTLLSKPSAFDRINVRRLFIILEKSIAIAAKYQLFEFNDPFTRAQFKNLVEPFLRDVQGRRGVTDFMVKCDDNNNTGEIIDRNEFVADIFIKPNRSTNFITLNFVATRTSVNFSEFGG